MTSIPPRPDPCLVSLQAERKLYEADWRAARDCPYGCGRHCKKGLAGAHPTRGPATYVDPERGGNPYPPLDRRPVRAVSIYGGMSNQTNELENGVPMAHATEMAELRIAGYEPAILTGDPGTVDRLVGFVPRGSSVAQNQSGDIVITVPREAWQLLLRGVRKD